MAKKTESSGRASESVAAEARVAANEGLASKLVEHAKSPSFTCEALTGFVNSILTNKCAGKKNSLPPCSDTGHHGCGCGSGTSAGFAADLIVLIDASGSMGTSAAAVSSAADAAIAKAKLNCPVDLRISYMGVDGTWAGTKFTISHRAYLTALPIPTPPFSSDNPTGGYNTEEGANAIEDLSKYYDWRTGACRAIFYISDEELDGSTPLLDIANEAAAVSSAVATANANNVTIYAHHLTYQNRGASVIQNYKDLCNLTGGAAYFSAAASQSEYETLLAEAICEACGKEECVTAELPKLEPCISIAWGDSSCDCFETDDVEIICVTICNCYSNVTFKNLSFSAIYVTDANGAAVAVLPDGTPSVQIIPLGPVCFGDIPPCKDGKGGCVSREFTIRTRGAKSGGYKIQIAGICFDVALHFDVSACFKLELCKD